MRVLLFIVFFGFALVIAQSACGQSADKKRVDSLIGKLALAKDDTNKVILLTDIGSYQAIIDTTNGMKYARQGYSLAQKIGWAKGEGLAQHAIAENYQASDNQKGAIRYREMAIRSFENTNQKRYLCNELVEIAHNYDRLSNYVKAQDYGFKALKLAEEINDSNSTALVLNNIGVVYREMANYTVALKYYFKALKIRQAQNDSLKMASLFENISGSYSENYEDANALHYNTLALGIYERRQDKYGIITTNQSRAAIYSYMNKYDSALYCAFQALSVSERFGNKQNVCEAYFNIGGLYYQAAADSTGLAAKMTQMGVANKAEAFKKARPFIVKGKQLFAELGNLNGVMTAAKLTAAIDDFLGDYKKAFDEQAEYINIKDSLFSAENSRKMAEIETERALLVKEKQIEADNRKSLERKFFFSVTGLLIVILSIVGWNFYRQRKLTAQKTKLANQKEVLLQEKDILIKEIHHRVKNNLQVVVSLLDLQTGNTEDKVAKRTMTESAARVKSISLIHRFLYQHEDVTGIEYAHFIKELFTQVVTVFKSPGQTITLDEQVPETILDIDTAVPMGLILNELLINSFKYAFPATDGSISITMSAAGSGYKLTYKDSGRGLPIGYDPKKATTMGMTIMLSLARQIGGTFTYDHAQNMFIINFTDLLGRKQII